MRIVIQDKIKVNQAKLQLGEALDRLLEKKKLEKITVSELLDMTGLSRSSFYYNFESKYALYLWMIDRELSSALDRIGREVSWEENLKEKMKRIMGNQENYRKALSRDNELEYELSVEHIRSIVERYRYLDEETEFAIRFFVSAQLACFGRWLHSGCKTPIDKLVCYMVNSAPGMIQEFLRKKDQAD